MSWLIPDWQKTVVFIGQEVKRPDKTEKVQIGTGALLQVSGTFCLITCKHVIVDESGNFRKDLFVAYNSKTGTIIERKIEDTKKQFNVEWQFHSNADVDIAIMIFGLDTETDDIKVIDESSFSHLSDLEVAQDIFVLGFQPGLPVSKIKPIVRSGIISRLEDNKTFYIDASVFPGNSGSPVILKPSPITLKEKGITFGGTHLGRFIGISSSYIPYQEVAISVQTKRPRVIFEENTGLSQVWSVDIIKEIFESDNFKKQLEQIKEKENATLH